MLGSIYGATALGTSLTAAALGQAVKNAANNQASVNINNAAAQISNLKGLAQDNSAFNAAEAEKQREWSAEQSANAMEFNAQEAAKNRDWQKMMSNTAHQREIAGHVIGSSLDPVTSLNTSHKVVTKGSVFETNSADFSSSNFIEISGKSKIESEIFCFINAI